jgi:hypothetical protein
MIAWPLYHMGPLLTISDTLAETPSGSSLRRAEPLQIAFPMILQAQEHPYELGTLLQAKGKDNPPEMNENVLLVKR